MLTQEAQAAEKLRLRCQNAGEAKQALEQLLLIIEGNGQEAGPERNSVR